MTNKQIEQLINILGSIICYSEMNEEENSNEIYKEIDLLKRLLFKNKSIKVKIKPINCNYRINDNYVIETENCCNNREFNEYFKKDDWNEHIIYPYNLIIDKEKFVLDIIPKDKNFTEITYSVIRKKDNNKQLVLEISSDKTKTIHIKPEKGLKIILECK
jgi:hypothetical protein